MKSVKFSSERLAYVCFVGSTVFFLWPVVHARLCKPIVLFSNGGPSDFAFCFSHQHALFYFFIGAFPYVQGMCQFLCTESTLCVVAIPC